MSTLSIPTAKVFEPLLEPAHDKTLYGGRGSGKSHFFGGLMIEDSLSFPGDYGGQGLLGVCIREVQRDLAQSSKRLLEKKLIDHGLGEKDGFKVFRDVIKTPGDGLIIFKGMNDYNSDSIKSLEGFMRMWWEEAQTATKTSIRMLRPTIRAKGSEMWWSYNPAFPDDPVDMMFRGEQIPTGAIVVKANWRDNPWFYEGELPQERLDCLRMTPHYYQHIWEGDYIKMVEGAYFTTHIIKAQEEGRIGKVPVDPLMTIRLFADIGGTGAKADNFVFWAAQFIGKEIRVINHYEVQGQPIEYHLNWLRSQGYTPDKAQIWLPHDGSTHDRVYDVSYQSALEKSGYSVTIIPNQGKGAAMQRVESCRNLFGSIWFNEETTEAGLKALGWYHEKRDENRNIGLGPDHDWASHSADAFGAMCVAYEEPTIKRKANREPINWMG